MIPLPSYIDPEAWAGFVDNRRKLRCPLSDRASKLILYELQRIKDAGHDPNAALDQSTLKGWRDVWPAKEKEITPASRPSDGNKLLEAVDKWKKRTPEEIAAGNRAREEAMRAIRRVA